MKALVLGGNGFIGSHLVDYLLTQGVSVRVFDRGHNLFRGSLPDVEYINGDFSDNAAMSGALAGIDVVYHLISATVPSTSNADPVFDIQANLINTVQLLDNMRQQGVNRIVYLSSGGTVYGIPETMPIPETHPLKPISSYGVVKVAIENYLHMYHDQYGIGYVNVRASNPYGPRQGHAGVQGVIGTYLRNIAKGNPIEVWGDGTVVRDFIHVSDLAAFCFQAGSATVNGSFNVGAGKGHSILDIIEALREVTGLDFSPSFKPGRAYDVPRSVLDISKAEAELGWTPKVSLLAGLRDNWSWVQGVLA